MHVWVTVRTHTFVCFILRDAKHLVLVMCLLLWFYLEGWCNHFENLASRTAFRIAKKTKRQAVSKETIWNYCSSWKTAKQEESNNSQWFSDSIFNLDSLNTENKTKYKYKDQFYSWKVDPAKLKEKQTSQTWSGSESFGLDQLRKVQSVFRLSGYLFGMNFF